MGRGHAGAAVNEGMVCADRVHESGARVLTLIFFDDKEVDKSGRHSLGFKTV